MKTNKTPLIPPLLVDTKFVIGMKTNADSSDQFYAEQCTPLKKSSVLPINQIFLTQSRLVSLDFNKDETFKIVTALNTHKTYGHDDILHKKIKFSI